MNRRRSFVRSLPLGASILVLLCGAVPWVMADPSASPPPASPSPPPSPSPASPSPSPSLDAPDLARGPHSYMQMTLKKTFLRINVATIEVRFDKQTQSRFADAARGKPYSDALAGQLAQAALAAGRAVVQMRFNRDISLDRWMGVVRENLEQARAAGLISAELVQQVSQGLPQWFSALRKRGYEKGDRLVYAVSPDSLRTVVASAGGQVLLDRVDRGEGPRRVVLASYFAPGSEFREPLLRSLAETTR